MSHVKASDGTTVLFLPTSKGKTMRIINLITHGVAGGSLLSEGEPLGSGEPITGAADQPGMAQTDTVAKDGALGCSGCQDAGYCRRGLGAEELGAGCGASGALG